MLAYGYETTRGLSRLLPLREEVGVSFYEGTAKPPCPRCGSSTQQEHTDVVHADEHWVVLEFAGNNCGLLYYERVPA
jgi:hypothetical protein